MKHEVFFRAHPVFSGDELADYLSRSGEVGPRAKEALLAYHRRTGRIVRIRRGVYAVIPRGSDVDSYPVDPFLIASKLTTDAFLSYHTALEFYGRAYSVHEYFTYSASRPLPRFTFRSHVFRGTKFPSRLVQTSNEYFGVTTSERGGLMVRVATLERSMVDMLDRPELAASWEEIWRSLESIEFFNLDQIIAYARLLGNATTAAKVGFFLDQHREALLVDDHHLHELRELRPRQPHYLDRSNRGPGVFVPEWNLVIPEQVLNRGWDELL